MNSLPDAIPTPPPSGGAPRTPGVLRRALAAPNARQNFLILTVFWIYVACSNVLYASSMQANIAHLVGGQHVFASWSVRLLQHLLLYPILLCCVGISLRVGWQPLLRKLPLQVLMALMFAVLADPAMSIAECCFGSPMERAHVLSRGGGFWFWTADDVPMWLASATTFLLTYGFALALVMSFGFYQRLRDAQLRSQVLERALSAANLAALRMQLSPHTLFNLLHTIRGHISWDPATAQSMVVQLGDLLRRLLTAGERDFSRLEDELQFVRLYLGLQQRRFADRLTVSVPQPDAVVGAWVPSLILQPLVENAVVHGLAGHDGPVTVRVDAVVNDDTLSLRVVNSVASDKPQGRPGIGLKNVRERLAIQFGDRASFSAMPGYNNVWIAEVRLPLLRDGPAVAARQRPAASTRASDSPGVTAGVAGSAGASAPT